MNDRIKVYADGACQNNQLAQNKGGYGAVIFKPGEECFKLNGGFRNTTNNRMELKAAIEALKRIHPSLPVTVYSDSQYVVKGITEWIPNWIKKGRIERNGDLWMELYKIAITFPDIQFIHVRGHNGNIYNGEADRLATMACDYTNLPIDIEIPYSTHGL